MHPVPHKDFSDLYEKMSGKGESAREAHQTHSRASLPSKYIARQLAGPVAEQLARVAWLTACQLKISGRSSGADLRHAQLLAACSGG